MTIRTRYVLVYTGAASMAFDIDDERTEALVLKLAKMKKLTPEEAILLAVGNELKLARDASASVGGKESSAKSSACRE